MGKITEKHKRIINCSTLIVNNKPWAKNISEETESFYQGKHIVYSSSKLFQEQLFKTFCKEYSIKLAQIRFTGLYGLKMKKKGIIWELYHKILNSNEITLFNATKTSFDFLHLNDATQIIKSVIDKEFTGILNAASGFETSLYDLATLLAKNISPKLV